MTNNLTNALVHVPAVEAILMVKGDKTITQTNALPGGNNAKNAKS